MAHKELGSLKVRAVPAADVATLPPDFVADHSDLGPSLRVDYLQAFDNQQQVGLLAMEWSPGGNVWLRGPQMVTEGNKASQIAAALLATANQHLDGQGAMCAQVLLDPGQQIEAGWYENFGYDRVVCLEFLVRTIAPEAVSLPEVPLPGCQTVAYSAEKHEPFVNTLAATYQESPDCLVLGGLGDPEQTLADYRGSGCFEPSLWALLQVADRDVGCLLLRHQAEMASLEIVYLGLIPAFRGRGLGHWAISLAMHEAKQRGCRNLTVAVDRNNAVARKLYAKEGFVCFADKRAYIRLPPPS